MKAKLSNLRISPRKTRLVANLVKGKTISDAELLLSYLPKRASTPILKLIKSAYSNAKEKKAVSMDEVVIKSITVDKGLTMKRYMPRAFGSPSAINKRSSHVIVILSEKPASKEKKMNKMRAKKEAEVVSKKIKEENLN